MFKVGDLVTLIENAKYMYGHVKINGIYKVIKVIDNEIQLIDTKNNVICSKGHWYIKEDFKLIKMKPKTEIEYLDCFQNNFKEGI